MLAAPPSVQELDDSLVVTIRARRAGLPFLGIWLTGWTFGGLGALHALAGPTWSMRLFFLVWLCGWAAGEVAVMVIVAWKLAGRDVLTVTADYAETRKQLGRFGMLTGRARLSAIERIHPERVPTGEDEQKRTDFRLRITSTGEPSLCVGSGMSELEADQVASVVTSRLGRNGIWSDSVVERGLPAIEDDSSARASARALRYVVLIPIAAILIVFAVFAVLAPPRGSSPSRPQVSPQMPTPADFDDARAFAIALTRYALGGETMEIDSGPTCDTVESSTHWTCRARATSRVGPFAGQSLVYRCSAVEEPPPATDPGVLCGPVRT